MNSIDGNLEETPNFKNFPMWKYAFTAAIGASHLATNEDIQDNCSVAELDICGEKYLLCAVADGAGSAKFSNISSKYICNFFIRKAKIWLKNNSISNITRDVISFWFSLFQKVINRAARIYKIDNIKQFATTLLFVILSSKTNVFVQIGDGIIAKGDDKTLNCVFLPQNGEYLNTTFFATDKNISELFLYEKNNDKVKRLVMFTDGIEIISFDFSSNKPHIAFFNPLFSHLLESDSFGFNKNTSDFLTGFLNSSRVNQRTDDDKTLVIASLCDIDSDL